MPLGEFNHWGIIRAHSPESNKRKYIVTITNHPTNQNLYLGLLISTRKDPAKTFKSERKKYHVLARDKYSPPLYTDSFVACDNFTQFDLKTVSKKFGHVLQEDTTRIKEQVMESELLPPKKQIIGDPIAESTALQQRVVVIEKEQKGVKVSIGNTRFPQC